MAKKVKPSSLLDDSIDNSTVSAPTTTVASALTDDTTSLVGGEKLTTAQKEKLERYGVLEKSVEDMLKEKEEISAKLAEYAERLENVDENTVKKLEAQIETLKKELEVAKSESKSVIKLESENKALREEVDSYLVKISQLTFENANLHCQLDEVTNGNAKPGNIAYSGNCAMPNDFQRVSQPKLAHPRRDAYNPYKNNGYTSW